VIFQWTPGQVHDTVAAIVAQRGYVGQRESLAARFLRFILDKIGQLLDLVRASIDAKVIIAAAVILVAVVIAARIAIDRRAAERRARLAARSRTGEGRRDAWTEARTLADAGQFTEASHALYGAVVETLTTTGALRYHRSKTAGDYARDLRRVGSTLASEFRSFGRDFDRLAFGQGPATRDDYERLASVAERIVETVRRPFAA
jgi:hypothetical protein